MLQLNHISVMLSFIFFFHFYFLIYLLAFIEPLFKFRCYYVKCYYLHMPLLSEILTVTNRLQPSHLSFFFFLYKFSIVSSPKIDWYGLQWDNLLSVFPIFLVMTQVCLPKPNQISKGDRVTL